MRVGLLVYGMNKPITGIGRYTIELIRAFERLQTNTEFVLLTTGGLGELENTRFEHVPLRFSKILPLMMSSGQIQLSYLCKKLALDVLHDSSGQMPLAFHSPNTRKLATLYDVIPLAFDGISSKWDTLVYKFWLPYIAPRIDGILTISEWSKKDIVRYLKVDESKIENIDAGISPEYCLQSAESISKVREKYTLPEDFILYVGQVSVRKNLKRVIEAYQKLDRDIPLVIVGPKNLAYAKDLQAKNLMLLSFVPQGDLPALYAAAKVFVFPSLYEGFGMPVLEAMASGTVCVCANSSSLPEVAGDAAVLADPYSVDAITKGIEIALDDVELRQRLREAGFRRAASFSWEKTAQKALDFYARLVQGAQN